METGRHYLIVTLEGGGNVPPVLGVARRLVEGGHRVTVLTEPCLGAAVEGTGSRFRAFTRHFIREDRTEDLFEDWEPRTPVGALRRSFDRVVLGPAGIVADETARAIDEGAPEVVVADLMMPGALIAAEAAGVPRAVLFHMPEYLPGPGRPAAGPGFMPRTDALGRLRDGLMTRLFYRMVRSYLPIYNAARRAHGLPALSTAESLIDEYHSADLRLILTSRAFDFPITPPPGNVRYVGPVLDDPDWAGEWTNPWPEGDGRPLVMVGLSSTFQNQRAVLERIVEALGRLQVRGLVTLGPAMKDARFALPDNVRVVDSVPHSRVLPHASAVVTHAGHGTVIRALASGIPLLCLPMGRDQDDNAARVVAKGAGLRLRPSASPVRIARSVVRLLREPAYRDRAIDLGNTIRADVAAGRIVHELEVLGNGRRSPIG